MRRAMMRPMSPLPRITTRRPGREAFHIDVALCGAGREDAGRPRAGDADRAARALAAAHRQNDTLRALDAVAGFGAHHVDFAFRSQGEHHRIRAHLYARLRELLDEPPGVFGAGQFLVEMGAAEAVVDALVLKCRRVRGHARRAGCAFKPLSHAAQAAGQAPPVRRRLRVNHTPCPVPPFVSHAKIHMPARVLHDVERRAVEFPRQDLDNARPAETAPGSGPCLR